jgi:hypothetical protein
VANTPNRKARPNTLFVRAQSFFIAFFSHGLVATTQPHNEDEEDDEASYRGIPPDEYYFALWLDFQRTGGV